MLPITTPAYVVTSPYTTVQVPLAGTRPVTVLPNLIYEPGRTALIQTPPMVYSSMVDSLISQQSHKSDHDKKNDDLASKEQFRVIEPLSASFLQTAPPVVYTSIVGDLISQQSFINAERKVDEKISKTVHEQIQKYELDKLREEDYKRRLAEYEAHKAKIEHDHHHHHHDHHSHHHCNEHEHEYRHHHDKPCERVQGSQTDLSLTKLVIKDDKCCCCNTTEHKLPVCEECVKNHTDCCLEEKIKRIRRELNLPDEKQTTEHDHREIVTSDKPKVTFSNKKYEVETRQSRSRSKSRSANSSDRPKSRSPSLNSRPLWKPTGSNDYTWAHQTRSDIINGVYRPTSSNSYIPPKRSTSSEKGNQTTLPNEVTIVYPTQYVNHHYHEIPVKVEKSDNTNSKHVRISRSRSRSHSKPRSGSPIWNYTSKNDYGWTQNTLNNYDSYNHHHNSTKTTKTTIVGTDKYTGKPHTEVYYSYETIRPKTSADHFYEKQSKNNNYYQHYEVKPVSNDYYYYETKAPKKTNADKSTSTSLNNAVGTQTYAQKSSSSSLEHSRDALNKYNVYIK